MQTSVTLHLKGDEAIEPTVDGEFRWITIRKGASVTLIFGGVDQDTTLACDKLIAACEAVKESLPTPTRQ